MSEPRMHDLATRLARGEESAFAELYDDCADRLHRYLSARLGSRDNAADVVQSAFLRTVKGRRHFRKVHNPVAYMFQIARNESARFATRESRQRTEALPVDGVLAMTGGAGAMDETELVSAALARLDGDDREVIELKIYGGLTFREIAEVTGRPQGTVATRYRRALESLRDWLAKQLR